MFKVFVKQVLPRTPTGQIFDSFIAAVRAQGDCGDQLRVRSVGAVIYVQGRVSEARCVPSEGRS